MSSISREVTSERIPPTRTVQPEYTFTVKVAMLEIYNEEVRDLLSSCEASSSAGGNAAGDAGAGGGAETGTSKLEIRRDQEGIVQVCTSPEGRSFWSRGKGMRRTLFYIEVFNVSLITATQPVVILVYRKDVRRETPYIQMSMWTSQWQPSRLQYHINRLDIVYSKCIRSVVEPGQRWTTFKFN